MTDGNTTGNKADEREQREEKEKGGERANEELRINGGKQRSENGRILVE